MHFRSNCLGNASPPAHQPMQLRHQDKLTHNAEQNAARSETLHYINPEPDLRLTHSADYNPLNPHIFVLHVDTSMEYQITALKWSVSPPLFF